MTLLSFTPQMSMTSRSFLHTRISPRNREHMRKHEEGAKMRVRKSRGIVVPLLPDL